MTYMEYSEEIRQLAKKISDLEEGPFLPGGPYRIPGADRADRLSNLFRALKLAATAQDNAISLEEAEKRLESENKS